MHRVAAKEREEVERTTKQKMARWHNREGGNHLDWESNRQTKMEDIDGGLHPAVDGQSLDEDDEDEHRSKQGLPRKRCHPLFSFEDCPDVLVLRRPPCEHQIIIIIIAFKGAVRDFFTISSLCNKLPPARTLKWPRHNCVKITCNTSSTYQVQRVVCHLAQRDSSAIKFDRVEITFILMLLYWL